MSVVISYLIICLNFAILSKTSGFNIQNVTGGGGIFLESPQWSIHENALYWVDDFEQIIFRMDGETGGVTTRKVALGPTTMIVQVKDHPSYFVVAVRNSFYLIKWGAPGGDKALKLLTTVDHDKPENNIADGSVDALGRLWFGTFGPLDLDSPSIVVADQATLYSIDAGNYAHPEIKKQPVSLSTGIAWSHDNKKMYFNDSPTKKVVVFDYDIENGAIDNETVLFDFIKHGIAGVPDGMTRDVDGNLWIATYDGKTIIQIDPNSGRLLTQIEVPVDQVSSLTWGGPDLDILYVTTGTLGLKNTLPLSGALLKITGLGAKGVPEHEFVFPNAPTY